MHTSTQEPIPTIGLAYLRTIGALSILFIPLLFSTAPLRPVRRFLSPYFSDCVTLRSLVPPEPPSKKEQKEISDGRPALWRQLLIGTFAVTEVGVWMGVVAVETFLTVNHEEKVQFVVLAGGMVVVWLFLTLQVVLHPPSTPPFTSMIAYVVLWSISLINVGLSLYVRSTSGSYPAWATPGRIAVEIANALVCTVLLYVSGGLPLAAPEVISRIPETYPDDKVTLWSWLTFTWVNPLIHEGASKELDPKDLPNLSPTMQTAVVFDRFRQLVTSTLLRKILLANRLDLLLDAGLTLISVVFNYASPFFLKRILDGISNPSAERTSRAYVFALLAFLASALKASWPSASLSMISQTKTLPQAIVDVLHLYHGRRASVRVKSELIAAIYDKALRRKDASGVLASKEEDEGKEGKKTNADSGKVVNLMAGDANRVGNVTSSAYFIYGSPIEIVVASVFLYNILGWSAFAGVVVLIVATPLNSFVSKRSISITKDLLKARDKRITVMNELIGAIQFIKFFAWTKQWKGRAIDARRLEMKELVRSFINGVWFSLLWAFAPILVTLVSFFCFIVIEKRELTVSVAFTSISLFSMLRMPLNVIPTFIVILLNAHVSVKRIEDFLNEEEVPDWVCSLKRPIEALSSAPAKIGFENATFKWNSGKQAETSSSDKAIIPTIVEPSSPASTDDTAVVPVVFSLSDLNLNFPIGKLSIITGPTGSGKSAVLTALLGEMELVEGKSFLPKAMTQIDSETKLRNSVAYAAQTPWLQQRSIKDNILFGEEYDETRYEAVLEACALVPDLDMLEDGDSTEIGAKGISLSGGQKARVALARAIYSFTRHVLLDDPLAAVDSHTAKHLTENCLNGPLLKGRTVLIVSHHVELLLPSASYVVRILDGRVDAQGTPDELRAAGELDGLVAVEDAEVIKDEPVVVAEDVDDEVEVLDEKKVKKKGPGKKLVQDIETIDTSLNGSLRTTIIYIASLISAIGLVAVIVPWFLVPAAIISYLYYSYSILYLKTGRSLRRLESISKSPIYSGFAELLDGVVSVRAFSVEARFMKKLCEQVDQTQAAFYYYWMLNRWLLLRFDVLGAVSVFLTTLLALSGTVSAGSAGMAILSAQSFVQACYWVSRFWGQLEMDFNAVERVQEYLNLPQEPPATIQGHRPPAYWPSDSGSSFISARDVEIKYAPDLPTVFKGSFEIRAGEKIGLIGRTGSGKSTLAMSLLRFNDPTSGSIWLDGIDITTIGVDDLHSDAELLDALGRVNLGPVDTPGPSRAASSHRLKALAAEDSRPVSPASNSGKIVITLSTEVSAGGSNFSQGQRQLVAMARALLRRSNLIIMDEATASVDFATDEAIQAAIRSEFKSSTLLTIAHRLSSVIDYDRLLVLSDGKVAEFDTPINLLRRDDSLFKSLCEKSGKYRELYKAAEKKEVGEQ
ncbi:hypothetical protein P7C73_g1481, partial [Tremellales sp. Uapishka_1]